MLEIKYLVLLYFKWTLYTQKCIISVIVITSDSSLPPVNSFMGLLSLLLHILSGSCHFCFFYHFFPANVKSAHTLYGSITLINVQGNSHYCLRADCDTCALGEDQSPTDALSNFKSLLHLQLSYRVALYTQENELFNRTLHTL